MVLRDLITQITPDYESDGMGGYTYETETLTEIECKASFNTSPEVATAYGQFGEKILYVVTRQPLEEEAFYLYKNVRYTVRFQTQNNRFYFSTLVEVKGGGEE